MKRFANFLLRIKGLDTCDFIGKLPGLVWDQTHGAVDAYLKSL